MTLDDWTADRERTVFIVSPMDWTGSWRGFACLDQPAERAQPDQFLRPPSYRSGMDRE